MQPLGPHPSTQVRNCILTGSLERHLCTEVGSGLGSLQQESSAGAVGTGGVAEAWSEAGGGQGSFVEQAFPT